MSHQTHTIEDDCPVCQQVQAQALAVHAERYSAPTRSINSAPGRHRRRPESEQADRKVVAARRQLLAGLPLRKGEPT